MEVDDFNELEIRKHIQEQIEREKQEKLKNDQIVQEIQSSASSVKDSDAGRVEAVGPSPQAVESGSGGVVGKTRVSSMVASFFKSGAKKIKSGFLYIADFLDRENYFFWGGVALLVGLSVGFFIVIYYLPPIIR